MTVPGLDEQEQATAKATAKQKAKARQKQRQPQQQQHEQRTNNARTSVGKRLESTASLGLVVPGPQSDSGVLAGLHRAPGVAATLASGLAMRSQYLWLGADTRALPRRTMIAGRIRSRGAPSMATVRRGCAEAMTSGLPGVLSRVLLWVSAIIWGGGFFVAYLLGPILERMDR